MPDDFWWRVLEIVTALFFVVGACVTIAQIEAFFTNRRIKQETAMYEQIRRMQESAKR